MRSVLASLRTLTLPAGVTTGQRILLDGVGGVIKLFDSANRLRMLLSPANPHIELYDSAGNAIFQANAEPSSSDPTLRLFQANSGFQTLAMRVIGDTTNRLTMAASGSMVWGNGAGNNDVGLARRAAALLGLTSDFVVDGNFDYGDDALTRADWVSYTPTWSGSSGTQPAIGNGTIEAYYLKLGRLMVYKGQLTIGSTTTVGTVPAYRLSTPLTMRNVLLGQNFPSGLAWYRDVSVPDDYFGFTMLETTQNTFIARGLTGAGTSNLWTPTSPVVPAAGDHFGWLVIGEQEAPPV